jgi:hypothetical protein
VNSVGLSGTTFRAELSAITHNSTLQCFITALDPVNFSRGAGGDSISAAGAAAWANLRVEGLTINNYVTKDLHYYPSVGALASAKTALEGEMSQEAAAHSFTCPGTPSSALAQMPKEMRVNEVEDQATSLYLVKKMNSTIPLTTASAQSYYASHVSDYDTLCISIALVPPSSLHSFEISQAAGMSVAQLARTYSVDASKSKGGAYGCYGPAQSTYDNVRSDVGVTPLNTFPTVPQKISYNGGTYALFVAVTKRTPTPYQEAAKAVMSDLENINASSANTLKNTLLYQAAVHVDPAFGRWGLASAGPEVYAPSLPTKSDVTGVKELTATGSTYK